LRLGNSPQIGKIASRQLRPDIGKRGEIHEIRLVVEPASRSAHEGKHQQVVRRLAAHPEIHFSEISGLRRRAVLLRIEEFKSRQGRRRSWKIEDCGGKRAFLGYDPVSYLGTAVFGSDTLPSGGVLLHQRGPPNAVGSLKIRPEIALRLADGGP
jgi:hypothetical protein